MTIREILRMGDERLRRVAEPVQAFGTAELHLLLQDMRETMVAANGAGLAAPQIGVNLQVVIFGTGQIVPRYPQEPPIPPTVLINPLIESLGSDETLGWEGCLSVPGLRGQVPRWTRIRYRGVDEHGQAIDRTVDGFHARVVQHECDHLLGVLFPQRMRDFKLFGFTDVLFPDLAGKPADDD
jgi:peptide deformylase